MPLQHPLGMTSLDNERLTSGQEDVEDRRFDQREVILQVRVTTIKTLNQTWESHALLSLILIIVTREVTEIFVTFSSNFAELFSENSLCARPVHSTSSELTIEVTRLRSLCS